MAAPLWCGSFSAGDDGADATPRRHLRIVPATSAASPDAALVERLRMGDPRAFRDVFDTYYLLLRRCLYRWLGDDALAEDTAQGILVDLWHRRETLVVHASLRSYLIAAARYRARDLRAHQRVTEHHVQATLAITNVAPPTNSADASLLASELLQLAEQRVAAFPPRMREIYRLSRDAGLSYTEIAAQLGVSVNTVYVQMGRAMAALRDVLGDWR